MTNQKRFELTKEQQHGIAQAFGQLGSYDQKTKEQRISNSLTCLAEEVSREYEFKGSKSAYSSSELRAAAESVKAYLNFLSDTKQQSTPAENIPIMRANQLANKFVKSVEVLREEASKGQYITRFPGQAMSLAKAMKNAEPGQNLEF